MRESLCDLAMASQESDEPLFKDVTYYIVGDIDSEVCNKKWIGPKIMQCQINGLRSSTVLLNRLVKKKALLIL